MNITFLIGNGFDLQMGLKSQPFACVEKYLKEATDGESEAVKEFKRFIRKTNEDTWGDFEILLGNITNDYDTKKDSEAKDRFKTGYIHFTRWLISYLANQEKLLDYDSVNVKQMSKFIKTPLHALRDDFLEKYKNRAPNFYDNRYYVIVSFNYTFVFDECLNKTRVESSDLLKRASGKVDSISDVIHVHGTLTGDMVLGVNDETQIANRDFVQAEGFLGSLIKSRCCEAGGLGNRTKTIDAIVSSDLVLIFGMSLGDTDKDYWKALGEWLVNQNESHRTLALYKRLGETKGATAPEIAETIEAVKRRFATQAELDSSLVQTAFERTYVIFSDDAISFNLIGKRKE